MIDQAAQAVTNPELTAQIANLNILIGQLAQFTSHVSTGAMTAHVLQWVKTRQSIAPIWARLSDRAKVIAGMFAAAVPAAGITFTFSHPAADAFGFMVTGLTWGSAATLLWSLLQNWVMQQGWYQSVIKAKPVVGVPHAAPSGAPPDPVVVAAAPRDGGGLRP